MIHVLQFLHSPRIIVAKTYNLCSLRKSLRLHQILALSLSISMFSCQTVNSGNKQKQGKKVAAIIQTKLQLVKNLLDKGQPEEAWYTLRPMLVQYHDNTDILNMAGLNHLALSNPKRSIRLFRKAYKINPSISTALNLSSAFIALKSFKKARTILKRIIAKGKPYRYQERIYHNIALTHQKEKRIKKAIYYYEKALQLNPGHVLSSLQLARVYKRAGQSQRAKRYLKSAIRYCPLCYAPVNELAGIYIKKSKYDSAINLLKSFISNKKSRQANVSQARNLLKLAHNIKVKQRARRKNK